MKAPLSKPNLPQNKVCDVAVSNKSENLIKKLNKLSISAVITKASEKLDNFINYHTDMLLFNLSEGSLFIDKSQKNNLVKFLTMGYDVKIINNVKSPYPDDSKLNAVVIGDNFICNEKSVDKMIIDYAYNNYNVIPVNQGYTKCSVCILNENAIITDDISIHKLCEKNRLDSTIVSKGSVVLNGYNYGFIGGCTGKIDNDKLLFNGDINYHSDCNTILDTLNRLKISPVIIENQPLTDIGSLIPLTHII